MPRIKISGITNKSDAKWAAILGVEFVSVSLDEESEKKISLSNAIEIKNMLPSYTCFIAECGEVNKINLREIKKLNPAYIQLKNEISIDVEEINNKIEDIGIPVIYELKSSRDVSEESEAEVNLTKEELNLEFTEIPMEELVSSGVKYVQLSLYKELAEEKICELKERYSMNNIIVEGDWSLPKIKKACEILQPYAWSIKNVIEKSPRKIDYELMKGYIREISLW